MTDQRQQIRPQPGFQASFLSSPADIVIGGGAAGAGKSYALLMEALRHVGNPRFQSVIFRRTIPQIKNAGGLWDTSKEMYLKLRDGAGRSAAFTENPPKWKFPSGATLMFSHLEHESTKTEWDGAQIAMLGFDELIHFTEGQFWYLLSRNRSASGVKPYVRATTNPQTSGWVKRLISWWIYPDDHDHENLRGMPIPERAGLIRWLVRYNERSYWGDTAAEAVAAMPEEGRAQFRPELAKSITFIPGLLDENKALIDKDPSYEGNLFAQDKKHGTRLRKGCWYDAEGENELFAYEDLLDMFSNSFLPGGEKYMSADIAMDGSDLFRLAAWDGLRLIEQKSWAKSDGMEIWQHMEDFARKHSVPGRNIVFDANGIGNFLKGFFRSSYDFRSQSTPIEEEGVKVDYQNLRTQCAYRLAKLVAEKKIYIDIPDRHDQDFIVAEFSEHKKDGQSATGKLKITSKEEIKAAIHRSPDFVDICLMRMVFEIKPRAGSYLAQKIPGVEYST